MPLVEVGPPAKGTYRYVLRRYDYDPQYPLPFHGYDESKQPHDVTFQGRRALTLFVAHEHSRDRATKEGWIDETGEWFATLAADEDLARQATPAATSVDATPRAPVSPPEPDAIAASAARKEKAKTAAKAGTKE